MNWVAASGLALLLISMGILAWVVPDAWGDGTEKGLPADGQSPSLDAMIRESRSGRRLKTRRLVFGIGTGLLLTAVFLILQAPITVPPIIVQAVVRDVVTSAPPVIVQPSGALWYEPWFWVTVLLILFLVALGLVLIRRAPLAGSASLIAAATLSTQLHLIDNLKLELNIGSRSLTKEQIERIVDDRIASLKGTLIDDLHARIDSLIANIDIKGVVDVRIAEKIDLINDLRQQIRLLIDKIELKIDKTTLEVQLDNYFLQAGGLGPEWLGDVQEFDSGQSTFKETMKQSVEDICNNWHRRTSNNNKGLVLAVGATDRIPLSAAAKARYESNAGLARARAEVIKKRIMECGIPENQILAIVSGPRNTPALTRPRVDETGYPKDRMVDVWAIWSWRTANTR